MKPAPLPCIDFTLAVLGAGGAAPTVPRDGDFTATTPTYPARANSVSWAAAEAPVRSGPGAYVVTYSHLLPTVLFATGRVHDVQLFKHLSRSNLKVDVAAINPTSRQLTIAVSSPAGTSADLAVHDMLVLKLSTAGGDR